MRILAAPPAGIDPAGRALRRGWMHIVKAVSTLRPESVATKDVPAYAVVVGNPGRVVRYRFAGEALAERRVRLRAGTAPEYGRRAAGHGPRIHGAPRGEVGERGRSR